MILLGFYLETRTSENLLGHPPPLFNVEVSRFPLGAAKRSHNTCFRNLVPNIESGGRGESYSGGKDKRRRSRS